MKFIHRLGLYLGGFSVGLIFLMFFLSGKKTSCAYSPNARVLKNISTKSLIINPKIQSQIEALKIDSITLNAALKKGNVDFSKSKTKLDSCKRYTIKYDTFEIFVENCEINATILSVNLKE